MSITVEDIVYRSIEGRELGASIFSPADEARRTELRPAMICMHGGAWITGDRMVPRYMAERLAARGFVVMSIDFRMAPGHMYPSSLRDANYAVRWLKQHAADFGVDATRVGGIGFSSGGHLMLLSAMRPEHEAYVVDLPDELRAYGADLAWVVTCSGVLDPLARYRMAQQANYADIIACHDKYFGNEANMRDGNPPLLLERKERVELPPLLMFQGGSDPRIPPDTASRMAALYGSAGGRAEALLYPGLGHTLSEWPDAQLDEVADRVRQFASGI